MLDELNEFFVFNIVLKGRMGSDTICNGLTPNVVDIVHSQDLALDKCQSRKSFESAPIVDGKCLTFLLQCHFKKIGLIYKLN